ncbi:MAG: exonuclease subunit SbcD [Xenococcaceae cyanobacterium MO_188.B29]|nr:exonuclease subunit SbcD [Xenococcaceae cyanobacterium MO_188.B29]
MKILHTSDWHLNDRLGHIKRQDDIKARLVEIAGYLEEHQVDVMVVAGDLLSTYNRIEEVKIAISQVNKIFKPFLLNGGTIITISGNHDREDYFRLLHFAGDLTAPITPSQSGARPNGRMYFVSDPAYLLLEDKRGQQVQFVLMPYPTPTRYLKNEKTRFGSIDEKNRLLHQAMMEMIDKIRNKYIKPNLPSVLVGHAHIRGNEIHSTYKITETEDVVFDVSDLPTNWAYGAFGHIHKPQALAGTTHIRYSGSIDRMDKGEKDDEKSVVLVEVGASGRIGEPICLPLNATPIYDIIITDPEIEIPTLKDRYSEAERALVSYQLTYQPGKDNRDTICQKIERIFPRWYDRKIIIEGSDLSLKSYSLITESKNTSEVVRNYLQEQLQGHQDKEVIFALVEQLLAKENL